MGKAAAAAIGSGILILQIANHNGYLKMNWDKVSKKAEEVKEKIGDKPSLMKRVSNLCSWLTAVGNGRKTISNAGVSKCNRSSRNE